MTQDKKYRQRGQALVEGAVSLVLIVALMIGGILLVLGSYFALSYKTKLAYVVAEGAKAGTDTGYFLGARRKDYSEAQMLINARNKVNTALIAFGLSAARPGNLVASVVTRNGVRGTQISLRHDQLGVISGGLLPSNIILTEQAFYPYRNVTPTAILEMSIGGTSARPEGQGLFLPMYGGGAAGQFNPLSDPRTTQGPIPQGTFKTWKVAFVGERILALSSPSGTTIPLSRVEKYGAKTRFQ